jgi:hypothetical protein
MSPTARKLGFALGTLAVAGGTVVTMMTGGGGIGLLLIGTLIIVSVLLEGRLRPPRCGRPMCPGHAWELTSERFVDDETGQLLEVWIDPLTGERRYQPAGSDPCLPGPHS